MNMDEVGPSLVAAFAAVPDRRRPNGRRHPLPAILTLATAAMLCGARSLYAIAQWGRLQDAATVHALGFRREQTLAVSTLHAVFTSLDVAAFETALAAWAQQQTDGQPQAIAVDGKALRGSHGEHLPGVDLVAAYAWGAGLVLAQTGGPAHAAGGRSGGSAALIGGCAAGGAAGDR
jgi:hypothetical protein